MVSDAEGHADEARRLREVVDAKNAAENLVYATEKSLKEHRDAIDEADASTIEGRVMELKQALAHKLAEAVYAAASAQQQAASTPSGDGAAAASDDEVVEEADYEVIDEDEAAKRS